MKMLTDKQEAKYERVIFGCVCDECGYYRGLALGEGDTIVQRGSVNEYMLRGMLRQMVRESCQCTDSSKWEDRLLSE